MVKHNDHAMTRYDYADSYSPGYDHGKIMAWQPCFSNPGNLCKRFQKIYQNKASIYKIKTNFVQFKNFP